MKKKHHHKRNQLYQKWSAKLHLWFGLGIGFLIFIISITGALYVFKDEVENITRKDVIYHHEQNIEQKIGPSHQSDGKGCCGAGKRKVSYPLGKYSY